MITRYKLRRRCIWTKLTRIGVVHIQVTLQYYNKDLQILYKEDVSDFSFFIAKVFQSLSSSIVVQ